MHVTGKPMRTLSLSRIARRLSARPSLRGAKQSIARAVIASASEAIHAATKQEWIASSLTLLAMTALGQMKIRERRHVGPRQSTCDFHGVVPRLASEPCLRRNRRHGPLQRQDPDRRQGFFGAAGVGDRARPGA